MSESTLATWTSAWESAQERLDRIRQELSTIALPTIQPSRVGQLDADSLDTELVQVLREPISKALGLFHVNVYLFSAA
jgi:peroxin-2